MAEGLKPAVGVHRQVAVKVEGAREHLRPALPALGEAEILHQHELGRREAVVHLGHGELGPGVGDPGLAVGILGRGNDLRKAREVVRGVDKPLARPGDQRERLDVQRAFTVAVRVLGGHDDRRGRPVGDS